MPVLWWMLASRGWACEPEALQLQKMLPPDGGEEVPYNLTPVAVLGDGIGEVGDYTLHVEEEGGDELPVTTEYFLFDDGAPSRQIMLLYGLLDEELSPDAAYHSWVEDDAGNALGDAHFTTGPPSVVATLADPVGLTISEVGEPEAGATDCDYAESRVFTLWVDPNWGDLYDIGYVGIYVSGFGDWPVAFVDVPPENGQTLEVPLRLSTSVPSDYCFRAANVMGGFEAFGPEAICWDQGFDTDYRLDEDYPPNRGASCGCASGPAAGWTPALLAGLLLLRRLRARGGSA